MTYKCKNGNSKRFKTVGSLKKILEEYPDSLKIRINGDEMKAIKAGLFINEANSRDKYLDLYDSF